VEAFPGSHFLSSIRDRASGSSLDARSLYSFFLM
jgi:hypothetical protein